MAACDALDPDSRCAELERRRKLKMARSAHAYVRGSTEDFYRWLQSSTAMRLPVGPAIWICGDCHVGILGPVGAFAGRPVIEVRDLDQTAIGNPAFDIVRLALSLAMSARGSDLPGVTTARVAEDLVAGYERAFADAGFDDEEIDREELPAPLRVVMKRAMRRTWKQLFRERIGTSRPRNLAGKRFWQLGEHERAALRTLLASENIGGMVTRLAEREPGAPVTLLDAAYWVKGCSSLGSWRAAALVQVEHGTKPALALLDIKEAIDPVTPHWDTARMPTEPALRVVCGARHLSPTLGARMEPGMLMGKHVVVRELLPQDLKIEIESLSSDDARGVAHYLGMVVGRAHGRQLDAASRAAWHKELSSRRTKHLDAPSWLWEALVELVAIHERAYLEHCRRFALETVKASGKAA